MQNSFQTQRSLFITEDSLDHQSLSALDSADEVLNWVKLEKLMVKKIYASKTGRPSYPLLTLLRALLLGIWYQLSDEQLANCLYRDLLFRKFCRLDLNNNVPDATTLGRFRQQLVNHRLWKKLLKEVNWQLNKKSIIMSEGKINIVDATPIEAAQSGSGNNKEGEAKRDPDAGWHVKQNSRGKKTSTYGYSIHASTDEDGFVLEQVVTAGNVHDSQVVDELIQGDEVTLYADGAYSSQALRAKLKRKGIKDGVQRKGYRGKPLSVADKKRNKLLGVTRAGVERLFAQYKRGFGLARSRFLGLNKNETHYGLAAVANNIQKGARFLERYGLPQG